MVTGMIKNSQPWCLTVQVTNHSSGGCAFERTVINVHVFTCPCDGEVCGKGSGSLIL
jgi:hypothetical protein